MAKKIIAILFISILGVGLLAPLWLRSYAVRPSGQPAAADTVIIPAGTGLKGIRAILAEAGVVEEDVRFFLLARYLDVAGRLKAGEYRFPAGATPVMVLRQLAAGQIVRWPVTIPEGATLTEIAEILARDKWVEREKFLALVRDPHFARRLGVEADTLEGYLFPETYSLSRGQGAEEIVRIMVAQLRAVVAELCPDPNSGVRSQESEFRMEETEHGTTKKVSSSEVRGLRPEEPTHPLTHPPTHSPTQSRVSHRTPNTEHGTQKTENRKQNAVKTILPCTGASQVPLTLHELLTLASIVEKETGRADERPLVACVFVNRLRQDMLLQADPTVIYGIRDFAGDLTREHLRAENPYNTYMVKGLPPTPIANPGRAALKAVLHPAPDSYLFFVSRNDGTHQFSTTLQEHNEAVVKYQKSLRGAVENGH